jgi:hypothetical protein
MYRKFIVSSLPLLFAACAMQRPAPTVNVPDKLKPPANESLAMIVPAKSTSAEQEKIRPAPTNGHSLHPRPISLIQTEVRLADTMPVRIGNRPMAARSRAR